jgi:hypothetical protein
MFGKSAFFALALAASLVAPMKSLAQIAGDAGVSGIPHGPGSAGGLNNSVNDPSGIGNAARIHPALCSQQAGVVWCGIDPPNAQRHRAEYDRSAASVWMLGPQNPQQEYVCTGRVKVHQGWQRKSRHRGVVTAFPHFA